jgi:DNA-binding MarR family transcriptional regulator
MDTKESTNPFLMCERTGLPLIAHPAVAAWYDMQRLSARIERLLTAALRESGFGHSHFAMLMTIAANGGLTQQELADRLGLTKANVSHALDRLEEAGLVQRVPEARAYALHLTDAGTEFLAKVLPEQQQLIIDEFSDLAPSETELLQGLMARVVSSPGHE